MVILPRQSLFLLVASLVLLCFIGGLLISTPVRADVGVQPILPGGSSIQPGEQTPIEMAAEVVTMNVRPATAADNALVKLNPKWYGYQTRPVWYPAVAEVDAEFKMNNPTSAEVKMTAWFPLASALEKVNWRGDLPGEIVPRIMSFQVSVDGSPLDHTVSELPNPQGVDKPPLPWASFAVTFPGEKETVIHITYILPLQPSPKGNEMALYYVFQTGAGWAGSIEQAELILNLPYPASAGTLAGKSPGTFSLPPMNTSGPSGLPPGVVLEENQARWTWKNFEPGPEDDFAVWLLMPGKWQELESARAAVHADPQDGQAWLDLASIYYTISCTTNIRNPGVFSPSYLPPGIEAYRNAADLMPEHPAPHAGLALLTLTLYWSDQDTPAHVIQKVKDEYQIAKDLEAENPTLAEDGISTGLLYRVEDGLYAYFYNDATATVVAATQAVEKVTQTADKVVYNATETAKATLNHATGTALAMGRATYLSWWATDMNCWANAGSACTPTASPTASPTRRTTLTPTPGRSPAPQPLPTASPTKPPAAAWKAETGQSQAIITAAIVTGLVGVGYLAWRGLSKRGRR